MVKIEDVCPNCKKPLSGKLGSITQWISTDTCTCKGEGSNIAAQKITKSPHRSAAEQLCWNCGRPVSSGRDGSFTQWIFRNRICQCPTPLLKRARQTHNSIPAVSGAEQKTFIDKQLSSVPDGKLFAGRYVIYEQAGVNTWYATDSVLRRIVCITNITLDSDSAEAVIQFQDDCRRLAKIQHLAVVTLLDFGISEENQPYVVTEFVPGSILSEYIEDEGQVPIDIAVLLIDQICDGLIHAHERGITHGGLNADKVLIDTDSHYEPRARIFGFGLGQASGNGEADRLVQLNADIRSVAFITVELLTGKHVDYENEFVNLMLSEYRPDLEFPPAFEQVLSLATSKDAIEHFPSVHSLRTALIASSDAPQITDTILRLAEAAEQQVNDSSAKRTNSILVAAMAALVCLPIIGYFGFELYSSLQDANSNKSKISKKSGKMKVGRNSEFSDLSHTATGYQLLEVGDSKYQAKQIQALNQMVDSNAIEYSMINYKFTPKVVKAMKRAQSLRRLWMQNCESLSVPVLTQLRDVPISDLRMEFVDMDDRGLEVLATFPHLTHLAINQADITDRGLLLLAKSESIKKLSLGNCSITNNGISHLRKMELDTLGLDMNRLVGDSTAAMIAGWRKRELRTIQITRTSLTDVGLESLCSLPWLEGLVVGENRITDKGIRSLVRLKSLKHIGLTNCDLTDSTIQLISTLPKVETLGISETGVTSKSITSIARMKNLKYLDVAECKKLTRGDIGRIRVLMKGCDVVDTKESQATAFGG